MSDQIAQIQASYHSLEDRILLKIKTLNHQLFQAWITRRYLKLLIPALQGQHPKTGEALFSEFDSPLEESPSANSGSLAGDFDSDFTEPEMPEYPIGEEPILLTKISFKEMEESSPQLSLEPEDGPGIGFPFDAELLAILLQIFNKAMLSAEWDLEFEPILQLPESRRLQ